MDGLTPRNVVCPDCGTTHTIYPDFDRQPDADLCGSCWLVEHSRVHAETVASFYEEAQR